MSEGLFGTRVAPPQLQQTRLQPAGVSQVQAVRPQQVQAGTNLRALADSLGSLNQSLNNFAAIQHKVEEDPNSRANKEWIAKRQQMTLEELLNDPDANTHVRVRQEAYEALLGERANVDWRVAWEQRQAEGFAPGDDVGGIYHQMRQEFAERLPTEVSRAAFVRLTEQHFGQTVLKDTQEKIEYATEQRNATILDSWHLKIGDMLSTGSVDPTKIVEALFKSGKENEQFFQMSPQEQDKTFFALAQRLANEGNVELAEAVLNTPREGGTALSSMPSYANEALRIIKTAKAAREESDNATSFNLRLDTNRKVATGQLTAEEAEALPETLYTPQQKAALVTQSEANLRRIQTEGATEEQKRLLRVESERQRNGVIAETIAATQDVYGIYELKDVEIPNPSGTGFTTITVDQRIKEARTYLEQNVWPAQERELAEQLGDPVEARRQVDAVKLAWYSNVGETNDEWQHKFRFLPSRVNPETIGDNPERAAPFIETAEQYRTLKAANPQYVKTLMDERSEEFLELYDVARTVHRLEGDDALAYASSWANKTEDEKARFRVKPDVADEIATDLLEEIGAESLDGESFYQVNSKVNFYARQGFSEEQIKANVTRWARDNVTLVNGVVVATDAPLPTDFPDLAHRFLDKQFEALKDEWELESADELYLQPVSGGNRFQVWHKTFGPVGNVYLDRSGIASERRAVAEERETMFREKAREAAEAQAKGAATYERVRKKQEAEMRSYIERERARIERLRQPSKGFFGKTVAPNLKAAQEAELGLQRYIQSSQWGHLLDE